MNVEGAKGECNFGQHEIGFLYDDALVTADNHAVYKTAAKEIAAAARQVAHLHGQVRRARGQLLPHPPVPARQRRRRSSSGEGDEPRRPLYDQFVAGVLATHGATSRCSTRRTSTPTSGSPTARSRRPRSPGARTTAPAPCAWSATAPSARMENRLPGGDVNPYLALAAMLAGGLHGIEHELELEDELVGNAYESDKPHVPHTLRAARDAFAASDDRPGRPWVRRSSTTTQHGRRRARRLRRRRDRLGAAPRTSRGCERDHPPSSRPPARSSTRSPPSRSPRSRSRQRRGDRRRRSRARTRRSRPGATWRPASGPGCCARFAAVVDAHLEELAQIEVAQRRPHDRQRPLGGRQRPGLPELLLRRPRAAVRPADPGGRAAWTSPSASRSAWSASSCRGTSRCRSPAGASRPRWRPATRSSSSRPSSRR